MLDLGVELGLEAFGIKGRVVGYCERDMYAQAVLLARIQEKSLEPAPVCDSFSDIDERWRGKIDWIVSGFPCQPWSLAGKRSGKKDERWIWRDILEVIDRVQPIGLFFENVPGLLRGETGESNVGNPAKGLVRSDGLDSILRSLAKRGFNAEWLHLRASDVGASHERERVFIMAYASGGGSGHNENNIWKSIKGWQSVVTGGRQLANAGRGQLSESQRGPERRDGAGPAGKILENTGCERIGPGLREGEPIQNRDRSENAGGELADPELRQRRGDGHQDQGQPEVREATSRGSTELADPGIARLEGHPGDGNRIVRQGRQPAQSAGPATPSSPAMDLTFAPGPRDPVWATILETWPHLAPAVEPGFCVLVDGVALALDAERASQLRCSGNGVVPIQAALAFAILAKRAGFL